MLARRAVSHCRLSLYLLAISVLLSSPNLFGQETRRATFDKLVVELATAQKDGHEEAVQRIAEKAKKLLAEDAGVPEAPDRFRAVPPTVEPLSQDELPKAFGHYLREIKRRKWWRIGEDPTKSDHKPREAASVIVGCCSAYRAGCNNKDELLRIAKNAGDYLIWAQQQGGAGVFPFPARQGGSGRVFQIADRFLKKAQREGFYDQVVRNGWVIDDRRLDEGGLQFDNGECAVALLELYDVTKDNTYLNAAKAAADWTIPRPCVPNWNYNSFSVYLLAETYRATGVEKYREAAKSKARLGIYPGQLTDGKHAGRWADPHNACLVYHYILIRSLVSLVSLLDPSDPDRPKAIESLRLALKARNPDFVQHGIGNADSAIEALLLLRKRIPDSSELFAGCGQESALIALSRYSIARARRGSFPLSPGNWGRFVEYEATKR